MKKVENKEKISQFWFVVGLIVIFVFFMNTLFLYDRTNSLELKELQGHYERAVHSLKQHSPSQQIVGVKKEAESSSLSEQDKHRRKSKKNTLSFLFLGTSHFFSSHFSSSTFFSSVEFLKTENERLSKELTNLRQKLKDKKKTRGMIPIVIMCYNRPDYLKRTIDNLLEYMPSDRFFIVISQDGSDSALSTLIKETLSQTLYDKYLFHHIQVKTIPKNKKKNIFFPPFKN